MLLLMIRFILNFVDVKLDFDLYVVNCGVYKFIYKCLFFNI